MSGLVLLLLIALAVPGYAQDDTRALPLGSYNVLSDEVSVSGFSSGGFMAVQFHIAFSKSLMGVGAISGGPYYCAENSIETALTLCTKDPQNMSIPHLSAMTYATALSGTIDPLHYMKNDRVYLFSCALDTVVVPGVGHKLKEYYLNFVSPHMIYSEFSIPAKHAMVTDDYGSACDKLGSPFINNCNFSTAYYVLDFIYRGLVQANTNQAKQENLLEFDQSAFFRDSPLNVSMDTTGFVYVPSACADKSTGCKFHIHFHGCLQGRAYLGHEYAATTGYNSVAEISNIIVLYPQVIIDAQENKFGCWDWWGYTGTAYATKLGPQMAIVKQMMDTVVGLSS